MSLENGQVTAEAQAFFDAVFQVIQNNPDAEVDWEDRVFEQLENEKLKCIHKMNKNTDENSLYNALLSTFHDNTGNWLFIRNDSIPNDLATTKGSFLNSSLNTGIPDTYEITISNAIAENGSNLAITVIVLHELIHAMMFDVLSDDGIITFHPSTGEPSFATVVFDQWCDPTENNNNVELNSLSRKDRFMSLICALYLSNNINNTFTHEIFENDFFAPISFHGKISEFLINYHDWSTEPQAVISYYQSEFGSNWKAKVAEIISWKGLEETPEFVTWLNDNNMTVASFNIYLDNATYQLNNNCND